MRTVVRDLPIGRRLAASFGVLCLLLVAVAGAGLYGASRQESDHADMARLQHLQRQIEELRYLDADISGWQGYIYAEAVVEDPAKAVSPTDYNTAGLTASRKRVYALLHQVPISELTPGERTAFTRMSGLWDQYFAINDTMAAKIATGTPHNMHVAYELLNNDLDASWSKLLHATESIAASVSDRVATLDQDASAAASFARTSIVVTAALALVLAVLLGLVVTRSVVRPLRRCVATLEQVAEGDLTVTAGIESRDEVGRLAASLDTALEALRSIVSAVADSATALAAAGEEIATTSGTIGSSADLASSEASRVSDAADEVSRNVETVATGSEQMGASIREISQSATEAVHVAAEAVRVAEATTRDVSRLGDSSARIGEVVSVITSVAEQTNLLALNATIEAARAGEAGKGFAVVATEVKELAQETSRATEDIARRIEEIQADAAGAAGAIGEISAVIMRINDYQNTIASAVEEQTVTTQEMNRNVAEAATATRLIAGGIATVAQAAGETTHGVSQAGAAVAELARMSADLQQRVSRFRH